MFKANEAFIHLFRDCDVSSIIWNRIVEKVKIPNNFDFSIFSNDGLMDWLNYKFSLQASWKTSFILGLWHIWKYRNGVIFIEKTLAPSSIFNGYIIDYQITKFVLQGRDKGKRVVVARPITRWKAPKPGFLKLNSNGAWRSITETGGGGVIRKDTNHLNVPRLL